MRLGIPQKISDDTIASWLYGILLSAALFGFPIISAIPIVLHSSSRSISEYYRIAICGLTLWFLWLSKSQGRLRIDRNILWAIFILTSMLLMRMFWDSSLVPLPLDAPWDEYWLQVLGITLIPSLAFLAVPDPAWMLSAQRIGLSAGLLATVAIAVGVALSLHSFLTSGRLATDVVNPISIGVAGTSLYIVGSTLEQSRGRLIRTARMLAIIVGPILCILSASKAPILELLLLVLIQYFFPAKSMPLSRRLAQAIIIGTVLAGIGAFSIWAADNSGIYIFSRFETAGTDESTLERIIAWDGALAQYNGSPLVGDAFFEAVTRAYPHNNILESLMTTGVVGFLLFAGLVAAASKSAFDLLRRPGYRWIALIFIQTFLGEQTSGSLYFSQIFWTMLLVTIAAGTPPRAARGPTHDQSANLQLSPTPID